MRSFPILAALALAFTVVACEEDEQPPFSPCETQADCDTGYACVEHEDSLIGICAETCAEGCAVGYGCGGADGTRCVPTGG